MLSNNQNQFLDHLYPDKSIDEKELRTAYHMGIEDIKYLSKDNFVHIDSSRLNQPKRIYLTEYGKAYVENFRNASNEIKFKHIHIWVNSIIAGFALLTAIAALIVSIMQLLQEAAQ